VDADRKTRSSDKIDRQFASKEGGAGRRDFDNSLAGVTAKIVLVEQSAREGCAEIAAQMMSPLGPVKAQPKQRSRARRRRCPEFVASTPFQSGRRERRSLNAEGEPSLRRHPIENGDAKPAGKMIVAKAGPTERGIVMLEPGAPIGPIGETFDHLGDLARGKAEEAMTALIFNLQQSAFYEPGQVRARRLRRRAGQKRQFARRPAAAIRQFEQDRGAHGIADQGTDHRQRERFDSCER
jgi:hypothetical protein